MVPECHHSSSPGRAGMGKQSGNGSQAPKSHVMADPDCIQCTYTSPDIFFVIPMCWDWVSANRSKLLKLVYYRYVGSLFVPESHKPGKPNIHQSELLLSSEYQRTRYDISTHNGVPVQLCLSTVRQRKESEMEISVAVAIVPGRIAPSPRQGRNFTLNFLSWQGLKSEL